MTTRSRSAPGRGLHDAVARAVAAVAAVGVLLAGCANPAGIGPRSRPLEAATVGASVAPDPSIDWPSGDWWKRFGDERLGALIDKALADSPTLKLSAVRLSRARSLAEAADAASRAQIGSAVDATRQRYSENGLIPPNIGGRVLSSYSATVNAGYEIDFFGRNRAALDAAIGQGRAAEADLQAARVLLATQVARTWFQLARIGEQRRVAQATLGQREQLLALVRQRVRAGLDTSVELRQAEGALPEIRQQIEALDEQAALARNALAALTAQPPAALAGLDPALPQRIEWRIPETIPVDLLGRRADVTASRWRIESAVSDVASARAQFYPNVNLSAFVGFQSLGLSRWFDGGSLVYGAGPAVRLPIFDAGRLRANLKVRNADLDAAIETYNAAIVDAVREVADQVASLRSIERQRIEQQAAQQAAEAALQLAVQRYRAGLGNYLLVLTAETSVLAQRRSAADLTARAVDTQLALVHALGGGYAADAPLAAGQP